MNTFTRGYLDGYQKVAYPGDGTAAVPITGLSGFAREDLRRFLHKLRPTKLGAYAVGRGRTRAGAAQASREGGRLPKMSTGMSIGKELSPGPGTNLRGSL